MELLQRKVKKLHERSKPDNSILLQLAVQGVPADAEPARCRGDIPAALLDRFADRQHFQAVEAGRLVQ